MLGIFISYRREDSKGFAGRLTDDLEQVFGKENVFRDIHTLDPGKNFKTEIERAIKASGVVLVLIGPQWTSIVDKSDRRRLDDEEDPVRHEIRMAITSTSVKVIPVLIDYARMPAPQELPSDIRSLAELHALEITDQHWKTDVNRLVKIIEREPGVMSLSDRSTAQKNSHSPIGTGSLITAGVAASAFLISGAIVSASGLGPTLFGMSVLGFFLIFVGLVSGVLVLNVSRTKKG